MDDDSDKKAALDAAEKIGAGLAEEHEGDGCLFEHLGRALQGAVAQERAAMAAGGGPAQVATPQYRKNYDSIFGARMEAGQA